jgi:F-type H+-transporting ATPase subunit b
MHAIRAAVTLAQEVHEEVNEPQDLYPHANELIVGAIAFAVLFFFTWKWVLPRVNEALKARSDRIRGDLEQAEKARRDAEEALERYERQLQEARAEASKIIDEARKTADKVREDLLAKAEDEAGQIVSRAQDEITSQRDRAFQELRREVGELSVELAERVIGESLDKQQQLKLVERYIDELASSNGKKRGS